MKQLALAAIGLTLLAAAASADVLHLRSGGRLEGVLVRENASRITVDVGMGRVTVARTDVARVERRQSPLAEFRARLAAADPSDARALAEAARFASDNGLRGEARRTWEQVLSLEPGNVEAHRALNHVLVGGRFVDEAEANRAAGLVEFEGRWMTPAEQAYRLRERERLVDREARATEARQAAREAEDRARRAESAARAREAAASNPSNAYPLWGYGAPVIVGGSHWGGYTAGCSGLACTTVPQIWPAPVPATAPPPLPRAVPVRPSSIR